MCSCPQQPLVRVRIILSRRHCAYPPDPGHSPQPIAHTAHRRQAIGDRRQTTNEGRQTRERRTASWPGLTTAVWSCGERATRSVWSFDVPRLGNSRAVPSVRAPPFGLHLQLTSRRPFPNRVGSFSSRRRLQPSPSSSPSSTCRAYTCGSSCSRHSSRHGPRSIHHMISATSRAGALGTYQTDSPSPTRLFMRPTKVQLTRHSRSGVGDDQYKLQYYVVYTHYLRSTKSRPHSPPSPFLFSLLTNPLSCPCLARQAMPGQGGFGEDPQQPRSALRTKQTTTRPRGAHHSPARPLARTRSSFGLVTHPLTIPRYMVHISPTQQSPTTRTPLLSYLRQQIHSLSLVTAPLHPPDCHHIYCTPNTTAP